MTTEDLIRKLLQAGLFLGAVFLGVVVAPENPWLVLGLCFGLFLLIAIGKINRDLWILYPLTAGYSGSINLIPGGLTPIQVCSLLLVAMCLYLLKADPSFRIRLGPAWIFWPFLALNLLMVYNWIRGGDLGLNLLGSQKVGGKGYLTCLIPFVGYVAALSMFKPGSRHEIFLPLYVLSGYLVDAGFYVITTLVPAVAFYTFRFYSVANVEAFSVLEASHVTAISEGFVLRFGRTGHLAYVLLAALQVYIPYRAWLRLPHLLVGPLLLGISLILSLVSGFRNYLVRYVVVGMIGVWQSFKVYSFFLLLPLFALVGLLCLGQGTLFQLPSVIQRTLIFLPGDWDRGLMQSTKGSAEFREDLRRVYFAEFFRWDNWLGEGFLYDKNDLLYSQEQFWKRVGYSREADEDEIVRSHIIRRSHHEGFLNIHHIGGHSGTLIMATLSFFILWHCLTFSFFRPLDRGLLPAHFGSALAVTMVLTYWLLYGSLSEFIPETLGFLFCYSVLGSKVVVPASLPNPNAGGVAFAGNYPTAPQSVNPADMPGVSP